MLSRRPARAGTIRVDAPTSVIDIEIQQSFPRGTSIAEAPAEVVSKLNVAVMNTYIDFLLTVRYQGEQTAFSKVRANTKLKLP